MEYYSAVKRHKLVIHATIRMDLQEIMLSGEREGEFQKAMYCIIPFITV